MKRSVATTPTSPCTVPHAGVVSPAGGSASATSTASPSAVSVASTGPPSTVWMSMVLVLYATPNSSSSTSSVIEPSTPKNENGTLNASNPNTSARSVGASGLPGSR